MSAVLLMAFKAAVKSLIRSRHALSTWQYRQGVWQYIRREISGAAPCAPTLRVPPLQVQPVATVTRCVSCAAAAPHALLGCQASCRGLGCWVAQHRRPPDPMLKHQTHAATVNTSS